jgi:oligopeptide/dipeptide ABC transporter ATP-binding protein
MTEPLLKVTNLKKHFPIRSGLLLRQTATVKAVDGVTLTVLPGETIGLVGESGCGKSTLGRTIIRIYRPTMGEMVFDGRETATPPRSKLGHLRRNMQMIFQDPYESLNPRVTIATSLERPFQIHGLLPNKKDRRDRVKELLDRVGLGAWALNRYPHEFSGGQRQRIAIARALTLNPKLIVADEPVSALDVSVQSQILNLLEDLQDEFGMAYLFVAHDLAVVRHMSDRIAVMYLGEIVEFAHRDELYESPRHPYTQALLASVPKPGRGKQRNKVILTGDVPSPVNPPKGCSFHPRCPFATDICREKSPPLMNHGSEAKPYHVACHHVENLDDFPDLERKVQERKAG